MKTYVIAVNRRPREYSYELNMPRSYRKKNESILDIHLITI